MITQLQEQQILKRLDGKRNSRRELLNKNSLVFLFWSYHDKSYHHYFNYYIVEIVVVVVVEEVVVDVAVTTRQDT